MKTDDKYESLKEYIKKFGSVAVAFSGGTDSALLLRAAKEAIGSKNIAAITVSSDLVTDEEINEAKEFCKNENVCHVICYANPLEIKEFVLNPPERCYICKKEIFKKIKNAALGLNIDTIIEGSNADDLKDYRPGMRAVREMGAKSPLQELGLKKREIREMSEKIGLETSKKPSGACLASRIAYGEEITKEKLQSIKKAEDVLKKAGFMQVRVRSHGEIARIEILESEFEKLILLKNQIYEEIKKCGFLYVTLDLKGYRTGSMNDVLKKESEER